MDDKDIFFSKRETKIFILHTDEIWKQVQAYVLNSNQTNNLSLVSNIYFYNLQTKKFYDLYALNGNLRFQEVVIVNNALNPLLVRRADFGGITIPLIGPVCFFHNENIAWILRDYLKTILG